MARDPGTPESRPILRSGDRDREPLADRIRDGDVASFTRAFGAWADELRRFAYRHVRSHEAAAEIVQDVFSNVWRSREALDVGHGLRAYLYRATKNRALDVLAQESVRRRWFDASLRDEAYEETRRVAASPEEAAHEAELAAAVDRALGAMPERRRLVCTLRWKDGLAPGEIAERLGIAVKTVHTQINRGLRELRRELEGLL
jgi:RNA polymerase sigma-70 factor (ECF subfamily)